MTAITPETIAELRRLEKAATKGPWEAVERGAYADFDGNSRVIIADDMRVGVIQTNGEPDCEANADLIVAARNALPVLFDEVERLQAENTKLLADGHYTLANDLVQMGMDRDEKVADLTTARQRIEALEREVKMQSRAAEMSAEIMRDPHRTGGWAGSERTAQAFDRIARKLKSLLEPKP